MIVVVVVVVCGCGCGAAGHLVDVSMASSDVSMVIVVAVVVVVVVVAVVVWQSWWWRGLGGWTSCRWPLEWWCLDKRATCLDRTQQ